MNNLRFRLAVPLILAALLIPSYGIAHAIDLSDSEKKESMTPDQVNDAVWDQAWTNLLNDVQQTFTPAVPRLAAVEVQLVVANPGPADDKLPMTLLDAKGKRLAFATQLVSADDCERVLFVVPKHGLKLSPGKLYSIRLSGGPLFGWKYVVGGYKQGAASFNGRPLLRDTRSTFLFRTFGTK